MAKAAWRIRGRVQGVGFRWSTMKRGQALGLEGRVWNRTDGGVEVHARGEASALEALEAWLAEGPRMARVSEVEPVTPGPAADEEGFEVRREVPVSRRKEVR